MIDRKGFTLFVFVRRVLVIALAIALICPAEADAKRRSKKARGGYRGLTAVSATVWNVSTNRYVFAKDIDRRVFPASTTKVMTVLLALERLPLSKYVTVSSRATQVQPTKLDVRAGEQYTVRDLIYASLLKSANDATIVLAEAVAGSQAEFVALMNRRAAQLGATHTRFANAHGLPSDGTQYTTARDMAMILREAMRNPFFKKALTFKYRILYSKDGRRHFLKSHNKALFLGWKQNIYGKTGYTNEAQSCFVGTFTKGKNVYIVDVFGCRKRWEDVKFLVEKYGGVDL
jgi:serine-type D-Ala-D-Ala carboxypeptidase (penicillin-binding protein 5/6)